MRRTQIARAAVNAEAKAANGGGHDISCIGGGGGSDAGVADCIQPRRQ